MSPDGRKETSGKLSAITAAGMMAVFITLFFIFLEVRTERYNYFLNLYGDSVALDSKALAVIVARDGVTVPQPELYINGKRAQHTLIDLRPDLSEISAKIGKFEPVFPVKYKMIENIGTPEKKFIQLNDFEKEKSPLPASAGTKTLFLLPDQFRAVPEFEIEMHLFCLDNGQPCTDTSVFINGTESQMNKGYTVFKTVFGVENTTSIAFHDGTAVTAQTPYTGKMLRFIIENGHVSIAGLTDMPNVYIDCYSKNRWLGTDIIKVLSSGTSLPDSYLRCDTIQASMSSASPGTTVAVINDIPYLLGPADDSYYSELGRNIEKFEPAAKEKFIKSYNSSFFRILPVIFKGEILEKNFLEGQIITLDILWWSMFALAGAGFAFFLFAVMSRFRVIEGIDGELISYSIGRQRTLLAAASLFYILFFTFLLYLLRNMA